MAASGAPLPDGAVLSVLAEHGPATGRGIARAVGLRSPIYAVLRRLERDRLVASEPVPGSTSRQRLYRLTEPGAEALAVWRLSTSSLLGVARGRRT